jgi:hypothetical protein
MVRMQKNWNYNALLIKMLYLYTLWPSNSTSGYIPKKIENISPHKNFYLEEHACCIFFPEESKSGNNPIFSQLISA